MSVSSLLSSAEDRFSSLRAPIADRTTWMDVQQGEHRLRCEFVRIDSLAVALLHVSVQTPRILKLEVSERRREAERIATRISYLVECLSLCEIDACSNVVQMRSEVPTQVSGGSEYFELMIDEGMSLLRYRKLQGQEREVIPFAITKEVLWRLLKDMTSTD